MPPVARPGALVYRFNLAVLSLLPMKGHPPPSREAAAALSENPNRLLGVIIASGVGLAVVIFVLIFL